MKKWYSKKINKIKQEKIDKIGYVDAKVGMEVIVDFTHNGNQISFIAPIKRINNNSLALNTEHTKNIVMLKGESYLKRTGIYSFLIKDDMSNPHWVCYSTTQFPEFKINGKDYYLSERDLDYIPESIKTKLVTDTKGRLVNAFVKK